MLLATVLALVAAVLHAAWNLAAKSAADRHLALWGQFLFGGVSPAWCWRPAEALIITFCRGPLARRSSTCRT